MSESFTRRCSAEERAHFRKSYAELDWYGRPVRATEPALGTLAERLDIIRRRFGPTTIRLTREERAELERARLS